MSYNQTKLRGDVLRMLIITTVVVLIVLAGLLWVYKQAPVWKQQKVDAALASGDTELARRLAEEFDGDSQAQIIQQCCYIEARAFEESGDFMQASALYAQSGTYEDSSDRRKSCDYKYAEELVAGQQWDEAAEAFRNLGSYSDAADRIPECRYGKAKALADAGEKREAALILEELTSMPEAQSMFERLVVELTGYDDVEKALIAFRGMSEEQLAYRARLTELRESVPGDIIDVGFYHTVGLGSDGRVYACGDNSCGQCDTASWNGAVAVSAGAWHTAALMSDGTVKAVGRNTENQCDTSDWTDIVQIAAADYATFGLKSDGTVVTTGLLDYPEVREWNGITRITAGSYNIAAVRNDGSLWFYPEMLGAGSVPGGDGLVINTGYAAALTKDGGAFCSFCELPPWQNVISLSAGSTAILALEAGGTVEAYFFLERETMDFSSVNDAVAVAAGGTHFAFVMSDGSVRVLGESDRGQADTAGWTLKVN